MSPLWNVTPGTWLSKPSMLTAAARPSCAPVITETAAGTSCSFSERFSAVTTIAASGDCTTGAVAGGAVAAPAAPHPAPASAVAMQIHDRIPVLITTPLTDPDGTPRRGARVCRNRATNAIR